VSDLNTLKQVVLSSRQDIATISTDLQTKADADLSNVSTIPLSVVNQLKGDPGDPGVSPTFTVVDGVLTITT